MSTSTHPIIVPFDYDIKEAFSSTHTPDYTLASLDYFPASPGNTSPNPSMIYLNSRHLRNEPVSYHVPPLILLLRLVFKIGENYHGALDTSYVRHEEHIKTILNHLDELPLERIEHMEAKIEGICNGRVIIQYDDEIVLAHVRTSTLETLIEDIQVRHQSDMKNLLNKIHKLKNHKGGPPDY
ncbi:hypothetical protein Tco_0620204 [Tanacetum coccineum]